MTDFFYDSYLLILKFLLPGIFLGGVYDIFRFCRIARNDKTYDPIEALQKRFFSHSKIFKTKHKNRSYDTVLIFIEDILFFIIVAITEILTLYQMNNGEIRIYGLFFSAIGFYIYQKTIGNLLIYLSKRILYGVRRILYIMGCILLVPAIFVFKIIKRIIAFFKRKFALKCADQTSSDL